MQIFSGGRSNSTRSNNYNQEESLEEGSTSDIRRHQYRLPMISTIQRLLPTNTSGNASGDHQSRVAGILAMLQKKEKDVQSQVECYFKMQKGKAKEWLKEGLDELKKNIDEVKKNINTTRMYRILIEGDLEGFKKETSDITQLNQINLGDGNTVLHIAARAGHVKLIDSILTKSSDLIKSKNLKQDTALHVAAKAGQLDAFMGLLKWEELHASENGIEENGNTRKEKKDTKTKGILEEVDKESNTLLHIVLENQQKELAFYLFDKFPGASTMLNGQDVSPIYLAIKSAYWDLVKSMLLIEEQKDHVRGLLHRDKSSIIHAVITARRKEILDIILKIHRDPIAPFDQQGNTPLSHSASIGFLEGVKSLLEHNSDSAFERDKDGFFPIHKAAGGGHIKVVRELFSKFKNIEGLLTKKDKNILHVASENGKHKMVSFLLKTHEPSMDKLINMKDCEGNTPLHLAATGGYFKVVYTLTKDKRSKLALTNRKELTALDASEEKYDGSLPSIGQHLVWLALRYAGVPHSPKPHDTDIATTNCDANQRGKHDKSIPQHQFSRFEGTYEKKVETLALLATLVVTVAFAAGLAVPGGYNDSDPHRGLATLLNKIAFQAFVISNTIAMYSSILAAITLIWAQLGEAHFIKLSFEFALPMLGVSLTSMSASFMAGSFLLVSILPWLAFVVLAIGSISLLALLVFSLPLYYCLRHRLMLFLSNNFGQPPNFSRPNFPFGWLKKLMVQTNSGH